MCKQIPADVACIDGNLGLISQSNYVQCRNTLRADRLMRAVFADNRIDVADTPLLMAVRELVESENAENLESGCYIKTAAAASADYLDALDRGRERERAAKRRAAGKSGSAKHIAIQR